MVVTEQQTSRAPIIVSPINQPMDTESNSSSTSSSPPKSSSSSCKAERSVIVRAGSSSSSSCASVEPQTSVNKPANVIAPEVVVQNETVANEEVVDTVQDASTHEAVEMNPQQQQQQQSTPTTSTAATAAGTTESSTSSASAQAAPTRNQISQLGTKISHNILLGRWRLSLDLFGKVFMEDVGLEAGSIVPELGGFPVKEAKFRRDMEKLKNSQQKDITLYKVREILKNDEKG